MEMWTSLLIVLAVFALGDVISILTKARISSLFVIMMTFLILFLTHTIPPDIVKRAGLETLGPIAIGMLLVNMGSSVDVRMLKREWRSVVGSIISMIIAVVSCLAMIPLIGRENALASAPVINGGVIATNTMVAAALEKGLPLTAALAAFLYATQKFVGTLPASYFGLRAARRYLADFRRAKKMTRPLCLLPKGQKTIRGAKPLPSGMGGTIPPIFAFSSGPCAAMSVFGAASLPTNGWA